MSGTGKSIFEKEVYQTITSADAGWNHLNFMARKLQPDDGLVVPKITNISLYCWKEIFQQRPQPVNGEQQMEEKMFSADFPMLYIFLRIQNLKFSLSVIFSI